MLIKTKGIIFKAIKYSESSLILDIYTEEKGLQKYIISGVRNKRAKVKTGLLQPATLVDMVAYFRNTKPLNRIKEIKAAHIYQTIPFDLMRGTISLFLVELAQKTIKEEEGNSDLFQFLFNQFVELDESKEIGPNFHLHFMLNLSGYLGFYPGGEWSLETPWFNMRDGNFVREEPLHQYALNRNLSEKVGSLLKNEPVKIARLERRQIIQKMVDFYRIHVENFGGLNTYSILKEVLEE
ncbi:MAG: DNA repair protein RecO [Bacteroidota bacterium]